MAVYTRHPHSLLPPSCKNAAWLADNKRPSTIFSSSEAIEALDQHLDAAARAWLRTGISIACHPRIAEQLSSKGYKRVVDATFDDDSIIAKLESIELEA